MRAITLGYHDVLEDRHRVPEAIYTLSRTDFVNHVLAIKRRHVRVGIIARLRELGPEIPAFLTFDDGGLGGYLYCAPVLEQHEMRGHFFITTDWIGQAGYMDGRQIRELHDRGHVIGSHSCSHPERMSQLSTAELLNEWSNSCAVLGDLIGAPIRTASVAGGYYSRRVAEAAAAAGIEVLFNSEPTSSTTLVGRCLVLGRYSIQSFTPPSVSGAIAADHRWPRWKQSLLWDAKKILKTLGGASYVRLRRQLLARIMSR